MTSKSNNDILAGVEVSFNIGLDTTIGETVEYDEDGDAYSTGSVTFADLVAEKVAALLATQYRAELRTTYGFDPEKIARQAIEERVGQVIDDTLTKVTTPTDEFGTPQGGPQSVAQLISKRVDAWLKAPSKTDSYQRTTYPSNLQALVDNAVNRDTKVQIEKVTREARDDVLRNLKAEQHAALESAVAHLLTRTNA